MDKEVTLDMLDEAIRLSGDFVDEPSVLGLYLSYDDWKEAINAYRILADNKLDIKTYNGIPVVTTTALSKGEALLKNTDGSFVWITNIGGKEQ